MKNISDRWLFSALNIQENINAIFIWEFVLGRIFPVLGLVIFGIVICLVLYIAGFWISYAISDEDTKEEKMEIWKKRQKGFIISVSVAIGIAMLLFIIGPIFGFHINI